MLQISNINHRFGDKIIFKDAKITIPEKEVIWMQGENGSGKTTFYRMLSGLLEPVASEEMQIELDGKRISGVELKRDVNYIPNKPYLFEYLSGSDNIEYLTALFKLEDKYNKIQENMRVLGLSEELTSEIHTYSLGMKAKLYLGVMLERDTKLILIDELLNNIDAESLREINRMLKHKLDEEGCSIIFSSHTQLIESLNCARQIWIENARFKEG